MVEIKTEMTPFRLRLGKVKSVDLLVQITNDSDKTRTISYDIILGERLAFDKQGRQTAIAKRIGEMTPGQKVVEYYNIFPKVNIMSGEQQINISAMEHYNNDYSYVLSKKTKRLDLIVE